MLLFVWLVLPVFGVPFLLGQRSANHNARGQREQFQNKIVDMKRPRRLAARALRHELDGLLQRLESA